MRQFQRAEWKNHIREELRQLDAGLEECPLKTTPRCPESVVGLQDLKFHLQDIHGVDTSDGPKRARPADNTETSSKRQRRGEIANRTQFISKADDPSVSSYLFVNLTPESRGACKSKFRGASTLDVCTVFAEIAYSWAHLEPEI